jgi:hypothetical protein
MAPPCKNHGDVDLYPVLLWPEEKCALSSDGKSVLPHTPMPAADAQFRRL